MNAQDRRKLRHVNLETLRVEHLRHETRVGCCRRIAEAQRAGTRIACQMFLQRREARLDPVPVPLVLGRVVGTDRMLQIPARADCSADESRAGGTCSATDRNTRGRP